MIDAHEKAPKIRSELNNYNGTERYHRCCIFSRMVCTDGVKRMAELCGAFWLLDLIASHQSAIAKRQVHMLPQFWKLRLRDHIQNHANGSALTRVFFPNGSQDQASAICAQDWEHDEPTGLLIRQTIEHTSFPLPEGIDLWVEFNSEYRAGVILLPSEH